LELSPAINLSENSIIFAIGVFGFVLEIVRTYREFSKDGSNVRWNFILTSVFIVFVSVILYGSATPAEFATLLSIGSGVSLFIIYVGISYWSFRQRQGKAGAKTDFSVGSIIMLHRFIIMYSNHMILLLKALSEQTANVRNATFADTQSTFSGMLRYLEQLIKGGNHRIRVRMSILFVEGYRFRVLATLGDIDLTMKSTMETRFSCDPNNLRSLAGVCAHTKQIQFIPDIDRMSESQRNQLRYIDLTAGSTKDPDKGILCIPLFELTELRYGSLTKKPNEDCIAVLSISCSRPGHLKQEHQTWIETIFVRPIVTMIQTHRLARHK
jgi:hypothetical protein